MRTDTRGVSLVELLVGMVVVGILGAALVRTIVMDAKITEDREAWRNARQVTRSAANMLLADLRMVETGAGVETASADGHNLVVRVPYAFGVLCATNGSTTTLALLPADSVALAAGGFAGFAWRDQATGGYSYVTSGTSLNLSGTASTCTGAQITPIPAAGSSPAGRVVVVGGTVPSTLPAGTVMFLFRRIQYEFKASAIVPGQTGFWRTVLASGAAEELAAPFDAAARFRYYVAGAATAQAASPSPLSTIRGIEAQMDGRSERTPRFSSTGSRVLRLATSVYFRNAPN